MAGMEGHIASPLQSEAQLNGHNIDRTNSSVLDDSPGISNQNIVESGNPPGFIAHHMPICQYHFCTSNYWYSCLHSFLVHCVMKKRVVALLLF